MPVTTVSVKEKQTRMDFQFWGDESHRHVVRGVARVGFVQGDEVVIHTSDARLVPLEAQFYSVVPLKPVASVLDIPDNLSHQHRRLLINQSHLQSLQAHKSSDAFSRVAALLNIWNEHQIITPESKIAQGSSGLSPEDKVLIGAFLALVDPSSANVQRGIKSLLDYVELTRQTNFEPLKIDTQSGEVLFLMCVGFDWLHGHMSDNERQRVQTRLWEIADICWNHLGYERSDYAQAHYLGCGMGLLAFSLLFWNDHPRAREWSNHLVGVLKLILSLLPPDGFFAHGINLWIYEFGFLLRWLELLRSAAGLNLWPKGNELSQASAFRGAATSPDGLYGITFGDPQFRVGGDSWCHYLIALRTDSGQARTLGDVLRDLPVEGVDFRNAPARRRVYECLWYPNDVAPGGSDEANTVFADGSQLFCRTNEALFTFRAGPPLGNHRYLSGILGGYGHSDPCSGAFLLFTKGSLALAGPGPVYRRDSSLQNIVTINGRGQIGDSAVWMPDFIPSSQLGARPEMRVEGEIVSATVDLSSAYLPDLGVQSLRRSILVHPGRYIAGVDLVNLENESSIEWNLHSWKNFSHDGNSNELTFTVDAGASEPMTVVCHASLPATWQTGESEFVPAYPNDGKRDSYLRICSSGKEAAFFWFIHISGELPTIIPTSVRRGTWAFGNGVALNFDGIWISREVPR
jgi:hypothetical protein